MFLIRPPDDVISRNPAIIAIAASAVKPSFLLWEKVYQKATETVDEIWLLRALEVSLRYFKKDLEKNEILRWASR